jgi:hypothetical protein
MHISPPKYLNVVAGTTPMLILVSLLQKWIKNLPILITNYMPFEKGANLNIEFLLTTLSSVCNTSLVRPKNQVNFWSCSGST